MLTIKQLVVIETQSAALPLRVGGLRKKYGQGRLSLRSIIRQVEAKKAIFFVQVRDPSILNAVTSLEQLQAAWKKSTPSKATLAQLSQILNSTGGSIVYLSRDWQVVGIAGTTGSLASVPVKTFNLLIDGIRDIASAIGIEVTAIAAAVTIKGTLGYVLGLMGSFAAGGLTALGFLEIFEGDLSEPVPPSSLIELPDAFVYGNLPPDVPEGNVITLPPIDITAIPEVPPETIPEGPIETPPSE